MADFPTMSLKTTPFQFAEFKPVAYTPQEIDLGILNRSMEKIEARRLQSRASVDAFRNATKEQRKQLNPAEFAAYDERVNNIKQQIKDRQNMGDYSSAIVLAADLGDELASDTAIQNKIKAQESREQQRAMIQSGNYTDITKRRWDAINKYYDDGTGTFKANFNPTADISLYDVLEKAVRDTPTRQHSNTTERTGNSTTFVNTKGEFVNAIENGSATDKALGTFSTTTTSRTSGSSVDEKTAADIEKKFYAMLNDSNIRASLKQNYDNMVWLYDTADAVLKDPNATEEQKVQARSDMELANKELANKDGYIYHNEKDYDEWIMDRARKHFNASAYRHTGTTSKISNTTNYDDGTIGGLYTLRQQEAVNSLSPQGKGTTQSGNVTKTIQQVINDDPYNAKDDSQIFI